MHVVPLSTLSDFKSVSSHWESSLDFNAAALSARVTSL